MKNPLRKRYPRELKNDLGKYIVIFLLLFIAIGFTSGFEVADGSMIQAYDESFTKYNVEDGHFSTERKMNTAQRKAVETHGIKVYDLFYYDAAFDNDSDIRIFKIREDIDLQCLMEGEYPQKNGEIAIDRMYADNNQLTVGDTIKDQQGDSYLITGLIALSDYSAMFQNNNDIMFDAITFSTALVTEEQFDQYDESSITWNYAWKYDDPSIVGSEEEKDVSEDLLYAINEDVVLESFIPRYQNQAITFTGEDMGSDSIMMSVFLYIVVAIIAFVYAVTTSDTISREANVIGTLRASGFTVSELVRHYMAMPLLVTLISALLGNIGGYTIFKDLCADLTYASYSLPTYVTIWNVDAFLQTTLIPCAIMAIVTWLVLRRSLSLSPLKFLRNDLSRKKHQKAFKLNHKIPFFTRFHTRVTFQNIYNYLILFVGILFGNFLLMFGLVFPELLTTYQESIGENMIAKYQYILSIPSTATDEDHKLNSLLSLLKFSKAVETENTDAEKFSAYTLKTPDIEGIRSEEIMLYGIGSDSKYVNLPADGIYISSLYADKYELAQGDKITLFEQYSDQSYTFVIDGIIDYEGAISIFMPLQQLNETFDLPDDYFAGYFSDQVIEDIPEEYISSIIDYNALTKVSRQLMISMGGFMYLVDAFCVLMFVILMYLLSKIMIEKNTQSISMTKILGYNDLEISHLYIRSMTIATLLCIAISIPLVSIGLQKLCRIMLKEMMSGWLKIEISTKIYWIMLVLGIASYLIVAIIEMYRIRKIPMDQALKNVE